MGSWSHPARRKRSAKIRSRRLFVWSSEQRARNPLIGVDQETRRSPMRRLTAAIACLAVAAAGSVYGQTKEETARPYVGGSIALAAQPADDLDRDFEANGVGGVGLGAAVLFGVEWPRRTALEVDVAVPRSISARQTRSLRRFTTHHRDIVTSALVKFHSAVHRVALEPVAGLSVAHGSTRLTDVQYLQTFCDGGIRHCAVPAPDESLGSRLYVGFAAGVQMALPMTARSHVVM